ncbi:branched-chain amino acid ABC transporter permease [Pseudacidovorax sp. RU35E]|uniref:branched-chain amino acid ABC transporter permease n=1 Tax=Pseudacidovorax sp. RU35E TaxID=1907403 RepID=UPI000954F679|nr:branched-chain amino acid ABC transporter permease [Pseudacidovorax sp. RU35E]SIQ59941.1 amino acid/amide ABC transporter membrane protein 2, HAAT family [Pseudacidovorax sp. RU35E]
MTDAALAASAAVGTPAAGALQAHGAHRRRQLLSGAVVLALLAALPLLVGDAYLRNILILTLMYAALAQAWNILGGYCGQISLGHALYFGAGAYATSVLFVNFGVLPWFGMVAGALLAAIMALLLGWLCFRLKGHYYAIATLVIAEIGLLLVHNWDYVGAAMGIQWPLGPDSWATLQFARDKAPYFYFVLALFALTWLITFWVEGSRWGYWWRAVKDNPEASESLGVTVFRSKMAAAALSASLTAIAGGFYAAFVAYIDPDSVMHFRFSLLMVLPVVLGGIGTLWGPLLGAVILIPLTEAIRSYMGGSGTGTDLIVYGALVMGVAVLKPEGLIGLFSGLRRKAGAA